MASKNDLEALKMANAQRERATADMLLKKRRQERSVSVSLPGEDGPVDVDLLFRAIGNNEYDKLVTKYPPTPSQKKEGMTYDMDRFAPQLLSRVCVDPAMTVEDWTNIWNSDEWNRGELMSVYLAAVDVCTRGLDVNPTDSD